MMFRFFTRCAFIFIFLIVSLQAHVEPTAVPNKKPIAVCFDFDDVITKGYNGNISDFAGLLAKVVFTNPWGAIKAGWNYKVLQKKGKQFAAEKNASTHSVIDHMITYMKKNGYGDFSRYRQKLLDTAIQPQPIQGMIALAQSLKRSGYVVVGATNQSFEDNVLYRKKLRQKGVHLEKLFDAIVTTYADVPQARFGLKKDTYTQMSDKIVMANEGIKKPDVRYYHVVQSVIKQLWPVDKFYFIDDRDENIKGANLAGMHGIQFALPKRSNGKRKKAVKCSKKEIAKAVHSVLQELKKQNVLNYISFSKRT